MIFKELIDTYKKTWNEGPGWIVHVVGDGSDKSDLRIVRVNESPDFVGDVLTAFRGDRKIRRNGAIIHPLREGARKEKKARGWKTNYNSWSSQLDDEYY